jgi:nucleotide-binding universal stress UspA family protein
MNRAPRVAPAQEEESMNLAFRKIVVATDFSPPSQLALQYAKALATRFGAALHLVHVVEEPFPTGVEFYMPDMSSFRERRVTDAERRLTEIIADIGMADSTCEVRVGNPARRITEIASDRDADVIVMGTHGRGPVAHFIMGSVAERVVRTAGCPVLTVRDTNAAAEAAELYAAAARV